MTDNLEDRRLEGLRAKFPGWNIWKVPHVVGPTVWCAQPADLPHHEESASELGRWLAAQPEIEASGEEHSRQAHEGHGHEDTEAGREECNAAGEQS